MVYMFVGYVDTSILGNPSEESQEAILADMQTLADDTAESLRDFVSGCI